MIGLKVVKCFSCKRTFNNEKRYYDEDCELQAIDKDEHVYRIMSYKDGKKRDYCRFCAVKKFIFENLRSRFNIRFDWSDEMLAAFVETYNTMIMNELIRKGFFKPKIKVEVPK
jgi:hypothetical protein